MSRSIFRALLIGTLSVKFGAVISLSSVLGQDVAAESLVQPAQVSPSDSISNAQGLNHHQWLKLSADGSFWGTLGTPAGENQIRQGGIVVSLIHNGQAVASATSAEDGSFRFTNIKPGVYSLVAQNPSTLAVMSLTLLESPSADHLPAGIQVRTLTPATERVVSLVRSGSIPRASGFYGVDKDPIGPGRAFLNSGRIAIDEEGGIRGRVSLPSGNTDLSGTTVYLTHSGNEVAKTRADKDGNYRFDNIPPGNYGFIATGPAGIAALGFVAVGKGTGIDSSASIPQDGQKFVHTSIQQDAVPALNVELASCDCLGVPVFADSLMPVEESCCPLPMAGCCGVAGGYGAAGGGGGGIGGSFGGGLLPLALIGGLTAVGIIASENNKSEVIVSPIYVKP